MANARVTIVTINFNNFIGLKATIESVIDQDYSNFEYLIVDGASTDGSVALLNSYDAKLFNSVSETDEGIYHAMNKAILRADGEWLLFMNSGDVFVDNSSLKMAMQNSLEDKDVIYADWIYTNSRKHITASKERMAVRHQSVIYKKSLHDIYGTYAVSSGVTISDYIFFSSISKVVWRYHNRPLSICEETGVSSKAAHLYQKISVDFIFGNCGKVWLILILSFYPYYKYLKRLF